MADLLLYKKSANDNLMVVGCIASSGKEFKTILKEFNLDTWEEEMIKEWGWIADNSKHTLYWKDETDLESLEDNLRNGLNIIEESVISRVIELESVEIPSFINFTVSDIKKNLFEINKEEPTSLQIQLSTGLIMLQIASFFSENPTLIFDFPLYEQYLSKHGLSKETYEVFDFITEISTSAQILQVEGV